jgi:formamidopyrimidine-DNA glycosylase
MPELPEVEVVRRGMENWVVGRDIAEIQVRHPRSVRRQEGGASDFAGRLRGTRANAVRRRGKYLWLTLDTGEALLVHLGMSGQVLIKQASEAFEPHLRIRFGLGSARGPEREAGTDLRFVDQRTFGHMVVCPLVASGVPDLIKHIAPDPLADDFDEAAFRARLKRRHSGIKRVLLDQSLISGVGNIYADEALWRVGLHGECSADTLAPGEVSALLAEVRTVLQEALEQGGTTFDGLYVNLNGESGYFERGLQAYGREGAPCRRCGAPIVREEFMNRSSYCCPRCQPRARRE